jgi:hypothetical protein
VANRLSRAPRAGTRTAPGKQLSCDQILYIDDYLIENDP